MSIASFNVRSEYTGNGTLASYTFDFKAASTSHIIVMVTSAAFVTTFRVRGTDVTYLTSVTLNATTGGTIVLASNLPSGHFLTILLANDEPLQASEFKDKSDFTLKRFEAALDVQAGAIQRLAYLADRSLKISDSVKDAQTFDPTIPIHNTTVGTEDNVDKVFCVGDDNASLKMGPTIVSLAAQAAAAAASAAAALLSEGAAASSAAAALVSQNAASVSASAALVSQNAAAGSQVAAAASEVAAAASELAAETAETNAETAETNAETAETNAAASALAAAASELAAAASELAAETAETNAETAETNAETAETNAETAETNAAASEVAAAASAAAAAVSAALLTSTVTGTRAIPSAIVAGTGILFTGGSLYNLWFVSGSGGAVTITAAARIAAGTTVGQRLALIVPTGANQLTMADGNGLDLDGTLIMAAGSSAEFMWDGTNWFIISRRTA